MKIFQVDAFTEKPFNGNPAAVCILEENKPEKWMQDVAGEKLGKDSLYALEERDLINKLMPDRIAIGEYL
jgi:predicted PhzF superfamily epimerase YddE/YHI9